MNKEITLSIVVPIYNEELNLQIFYERLVSVINKIGYQYEFIFVNDGSIDNSIFILQELHKRDYKVKIINLSRNFGKEIALTAGLDCSSGDAVIPIDADLQDPPEVIYELIKKWQEGYDVVYAIRKKRIGDSVIKKVSTHLFYRLISKLCRIEIPRDTGDFRLMSKQVIEAMRQLREQHRFMKGLFSWVGFKQTGIVYSRDPRYAGKSSFNYWRLLHFAIEGITSFSFIPLQISSYVGLLVALFAIFYGIYITILTLVKGNPVPGYPSLMISILFLGGIQLISLGAIGEYIGRIYNESKNRPLYLIKSKFGFSENQIDNFYEENYGRQNLLKNGRS
ncbi:MAG: glycosyltransferase family 2 protein [Candidatus Gastranaerophilales bacterium]|nr:glycosyltransferase family 2 protein [Candidatus Gastranaerophilales bacterium]